MAFNIKNFVIAGGNGEKGKFKVEQSKRGYFLCPCRGRIQLCRDFEDKFEEGREYTIIIGSKC